MRHDVSSTLASDVSGVQLSPQTSFCWCSSPEGVPALHLCVALRFSGVCQFELIPECLLPDFIEFGELNRHQLTWLRSKLRFPDWCRKATLQSKSVQMIENVEFQKQKSED